jgi:hypothetical protein
MDDAPCNLDHYDSREKILQVWKVLYETEKKELGSVAYMRKIITPESFYLNWHHYQT